MIKSLLVMKKLIIELTKHYTTIYNKSYSPNGELRLLYKPLPASLTNDTSRINDRIKHKHVIGQMNEP